MSSAFNFNSKRTRELARLFKKNNINLIVYDFDGVMTDNKVLMTEDGKEAVVCNRADGIAIQGIKQLGIPQIILSTESNPIVKIRAEKVGLFTISNINDKKLALQDYCKKKNYKLKKVIYIGNDINDLDVMKIVGLPICPNDAHNKIKEISKIVLLSAGGQGIVRELYSYLLNAN